MSAKAKNFTCQIGIKASSIREIPKFIDLTKFEMVSGVVSHIQTRSSCSETPCNPSA
jgi:hypothetical protein